MTTVSDALREAAARLAKTSDTARLDAEILVAHAVGVSRSDLLLRHMREEAPAGWIALVERRASHEPVAYITGRQAFFGREFAVSPAVLIPRPDSETTVAAALDSAPAPARVLDCGVGSGALLLTVLAECGNARGVGVDRSAQALAVAAANADNLGLASRVETRLTDWTVAGWADGLGEFDLIIANPPYVEAGAALDPDVREFEPAGALFAGPDGLEDYRSLVPQLPGLLANVGVAVIEIGATQSQAVAALARSVGFNSELRHDLAGRPRAVILRLGLGR